MASVRVRAWRAAFSRLREAASSPAAALQSLQDLFSQTKVMVTAAPDLPPEEVVGDILFVVQLVSSELILPPNSYNSRSVCGKVCCLIMEINSHTHLSSVPAYVPSVLHFLQNLIQISACIAKDAAPRQDFQGWDGHKLCLEALQAVGQVVHENGEQLSSNDVASITSALLNLVKCQELSSSSLSESRSEAAGSGAKTRNWETQRLVFVAVGNLLARAGNSVSTDTWHEVVKTLRDIMDALTLGGQLVEDKAASRFYAAILRCVQLALTDAKGSVVEHVAGLVAALRFFFVYGLSNNPPVKYATQSNDGRMNEANRMAPSGQSVYRPPHLRRSLNETAFHSLLNDRQSSHPVESEEAGMRFLSSDSEQSDSDGSLGDGDRFKSSKARAAAIFSIQAVARADSKALHAHWMLLLPTHDILNPRRYHATLLNTVLFDPVFKVRMAAASTISVMLEGPSRAFIQVAEYKESGKFGSFTTLSSSLGQILVQLQRGLVYLVLNEPHVGLLMASLKALSLFVTAAPFGRLPDELLPNTIHAVHKRTKDLLSSATDQTNAVCVAISCLGCALNTVPAYQHVAMMLSNEVSGAKNKQQLLSDLLFCTQPLMPSLVRVEALQVLKVAVNKYPSVLFSYWDSISAVVKGTIESSAGEQPAGVVLDTSVAPAGLTLNLTDEKTVYASVKLLDEFLRAVSGSRGLDDTLDDGPLQSPSPSVLPSCINAFSAPGSFPVTRTCGYEKIQDVAGSSQWNESLQDYLPLMLKHSTAMVRGAALTCFAGLTSAIFCTLPDNKQNFVMDTVMEAAVHDEIPSVRSAACRTIGVLISFPRVIGRSDILRAATEVVISSTKDLSISVRITASWALANICDALRNTSESGNTSIVKSTPVTALAECALKLSKDGDKVRANAVRALGNLARFVSFGAGNACRVRLPASEIEYVAPKGTEHGTSDMFPWLERMVQTLVSCVTTGNVKVQWNVCHALGNLFLNPSISLPEMTWAASVYRILLLLLRDSANFKIRIQASSALAVPSSREDYGDSFHDVVQALVLVLESLDSYQVVAPSSFKYMNALNEQLTATCLHVLGLAIPEDYDGLQDFLLKHGTFLEGWLKSAYASAVRMTSNGCQCFEKEDYNRINSGQLASGRHGRDSSCSMYVEKLLPPPKERIWYALDGESSISRKEYPLTKITVIRKVVEALIKMYRYGGQTNVLLFEQLLAQFSS